MNRIAKLAISALGSLASFAPSSQPYRSPPTAAEAFRGDWLRLGADFSTVIRREQGRGEKKVPNKERTA